MPIHILSETVAAQIAAGEVIERPASVVKELLENALDAGANAITIDIHGAGRQLIRIRDNGIGIPAEDISLSLYRHATSKMSVFDDLNTLQTLGFRGEALHSIASISRLTLTSRHRDEEVGARIISEGGNVLETRSIGTPTGTIVEVADLFYNTPARRKFLKSDVTERRHIISLITQYAMAYADVRFQLNIDGREAFHSTGNGNLSDVLIEAFGLELFRQMVEVSPLAPARPDLPAIEVYGYTTTPDIDRANRAQIHLFINGRLISDQRLTYAVVQAYHTLLPSGRYPVAVLMINLASEDVDVNVHPTKAEVRFRSPEAVFSAVQRAVRMAVTSQSHLPTMQERPYHPENMLAEDDLSDDDTDLQRNQRLSALMSAGRPRTTKPNEQLDLDFQTYSAGRYTKQIDPQEEATETDEDAFYPHYPSPAPKHQQAAPSSNSDPNSLPEGMGKPTRPRSLPIMRVVGQIAATYIIAEGPGAMYLIDQHAAHERIQYEQFMAAFHAQDIAVQQVLQTVTVELGTLQARLLEEYHDILAAVGFHVESFGKNLFRILSVPAILADQDPAQVLYRLLQDVEVGHAPGAQVIEDKIIKRVCKAASIKAGQVLSHAEMQSLIQQLERCENPRTCPHGRPTLIHLTTNQLEKEFGRV